MVKRVNRIERSISIRTRDYYALSSTLDMFYLAGPWVVSVGFLLLLPFLLRENYYYLGIFTTAGIYSLLAISWTLLAMIRLFSLGHAMYLGVAGYIIGLLNTRLHMHIGLSLVLGLLIGTVICVGILTLCLKVKNIYFLLATFIIPLMMAQLFFLFPRIFRGEEGISGIATLSYGPIPFQIGNYYLVTIAALLILIWTRRFINSKNLGLIIVCIGDNEYAVEASGLNVWKYKVLLFTVSTSIALLGGALNTVQIGYVGPSSLAMDISLLPLIGSTIGGISRGIAGSVFGTYLIVILLESLRITSNLKIVIYTIILIGVMLMRPKGLFHYMTQTYHYFKRSYHE